MASNIYIQHTADGKSHLARRYITQGRKSLPVELVKVKAEAMMLPETKARAVAEAKKHSLSLSAYIDLAVSLFDISKLQ